MPREDVLDRRHVSLVQVLTLVVLRDLGDALDLPKLGCEPLRAFRSLLRFLAEQRHHEVLQARRKAAGLREARRLVLNVRRGDGREVLRLVERPVAEEKLVQQ